MLESQNGNVWIGILSAIGGVLAVLGAKDLIPAILKWWEEKRAHSRATKEKNSENIQSLYRRIERLEDELDRSRGFELKAYTAFNSMIPLMKEMMKDHPNHVRLLDQLQNSIFGGNITPTDGVHHTNKDEKEL